MPNDTEHLRLLAIFHYVVGGLVALFSLFPVFHLVMGIAMVTGRFDDSSRGEAAIFGWFFIAIAAAMMAAGLGFAAALIAAGRCLARHTQYTFCLVVAALACAFVPFGTVLGVFTIIVLQRPTVKLLFETPAGHPVPGT